MTQGAMPGGAGASGGAEALSYAKKQDRDGGTQAGIARNVVVIFLKCVGFMFVLGAAWQGIEAVFRAISVVSGLLPTAYWSFGQLVVDCLVDPAETYVVGLMLILGAEWIAPWLLPRTWWQ